MAIWLIGMQLYFLQAFFLLPRKRVAARFGMQLYYSLTPAPAFYHAPECSSGGPLCVYVIGRNSQADQPLGLARLEIEIARQPVIFGQLVAHLRDQGIKVIHATPLV
ncbi:hypothetical protein ABMV91_002723 [Shigella boydii]